MTNAWLQDAWIRSTEEEKYTMAKWNLDKEPVPSYLSGKGKISGASVEVVSNEPKEDMVNSPPHYGTGEIECIDYISDFLSRDEYVGYLRGNIAKYLHRWRYKNGIEDLNKAQWYLQRLIKVEENP